ncbi:MAG: tripartite tricarboxylate transporter substrate binding protein [Betaproteobacteria bacterium]|nr:tripartite tricarboxylate transporter substrate binding protein [Betaproteobacteria bacterium]
MTHQLRTFFALFLCAGFATAAQAQNYPERPIRLIVPFSPGGTSDLVGRLVAARLSELGQPVIVDNRGGGGSTLGTGIAARATPDGYTLIVSHIALAINQTLYSKLPYIAMKDLAPISKLGVAPSAVVVNNKLPVRNLAELIALAKQEPGKLNYGSAGVGSAGHLSVALLEYVAGVKFTHVPYKGGGPSVAATIAGEVQLSIPVLASAASLVKAGRLRMLAVTSAKRSHAVPDVPTAKEAGVPNYVFETWFGLFAPAGTPQSIVTKLNQVTVKALGMKDVRDQLAAQGVEADPSTPSELGRMLRDDTATWAKIIRSAGIPTN